MLYAEAFKKCVAEAASFSMRKTLCCRCDQNAADESKILRRRVQKFHRRRGNAADANNYLAMRDLQNIPISEGVRPCRARNTTTRNLYAMRLFSDNQWNCFNTAVTLRRSPRLTSGTVLAAERCTISK